MLYGGVLAVFYVSLYCRIRLAILADVFGNTGCEALVALDGEMLSGSLPVKQQRILDGWLALHEEEAYAAWNLAVQGKHFEKIVSGI